MAGDGTLDNATGALLLYSSFDSSEQKPLKIYRHERRTKSPADRLLL